MTHGNNRALRWSPDHLGRFVDGVRDDRYFSLWMLIATTGIRIDSLLDLRRGDVDLQEARLSPRPAPSRSAKTSVRGVAKTYALDPDTYQALRAHVIAWDKTNAGPDLRSKHLFAWEDGEPLHPKSVEVLFRRHCDKAGLPLVPMQAVRQAYVVAALETGIPTAVISERLGHAVTATSITRIPRVDVPTAGSRGAGSGTSAGRSVRGSERKRTCHLRSC